MPGASSARRWGPAIACGAAALLAAIGSLADAPTGPHSNFSPEKGELFLPLHRGAINPFEITIAKQPDDCRHQPDLTIKWDQEANTVHVNLEGEKVLFPHPTILRTPGVDYTPNQFFPEPQNVINGRYQFWIITTGPLVTFYYDPATLNLIGSEWDFDTPPAAIPIQLPSLL